MNRGTAGIQKDKVTVLYDGNCGFCSRIVCSLKVRNEGVGFQYLPIDSDTSRDLLAEYGLPADGSDSIVLIDGRRALLKSDAVLRILKELGGFGRVWGALFFVPKRWRDRVYDLVARNRHCLSATLRLRRDGGAT